MPDNAQHPSGGIEPGDTIEVPDDAYNFGQGTLRMDVTRVGAPVRRHDGTVWREVHGFQLAAGRRHPNERVATVRVNAVRKVSNRRP